MLYISAKFCDIISNGIKVIERTRFLYEITKGNYSAKNVGEVTVVNLCTSPGHVYISTKFCEIKSNGIKIIERARFLY